MDTPQLLRPMSVCPATWSPILWREWQKFQASVWKLIFAFALMFLVMPFDPNGSLLLISALLAGQYLAVILGGSDISEGAERYAFVLPLRRADYFWARYLGGLTLLCSLVGSAYLLNTFDLHPYFWGLFCESGLSERRHASYPEEPIANFILCALLAYSSTYCLAANARKPAALAGSWFVGLFATYAAPAIVIGVISIIKNVSPVPSQKGLPFILLSALISALLLYQCSRSYVGKGADANEEPASKSSSVTVTLIFMVVIVIVINLFTSKA